MSPHRQRVLEALPPDTAAWISSHASPDTLEQVARDVAVLTGQRLLEDDGAAGWDHSLHKRLLANASPAISAIARALGCHGHRWSAYGVAASLCDHFGLASAFRDIYDRLRPCRIVEFVQDRHSAA